jgi:hypothetical protein
MPGRGGRTATTVVHAAAPRLAAMIAIEMRRFMVGCSLSQKTSNLSLALTNDRVNKNAPVCTGAFSLSRRGDRYFNFDFVSFAILR